MIPLPPDHREWRSEHYIELMAQLVRGELSVPEAAARYGLPAETLEAGKAGLLAWVEQARAQTSVPAHLSDPRDLKVQRSLDALRYTLTDWDRFPWTPLKLLAIAFVFGIVGMAVTNDGPGVSDGIEALISLLILQPIPAFLVAILYTMLRHRVEVAIDPRGLTQRSGGRVRRLNWSDYTAVQRQGRRVSVRHPGGWIALPSPSAYVDAMWMERIAQEGIAANAGSQPGAVPQELAALRAQAAPERR